MVNECVINRGLIDNIELNVIILFMPMIMHLPSIDCI